MKGTGPGQFNVPGGVAVVGNSDLYITDFYNQRIQQLRTDGAVFVADFRHDQMSGWRPDR